MRKIEDLRTALIDDLAVSERESLDVVPMPLIRGLEALNRLIEQHNVAYPIERHLPIDCATGELLSGAEVWRPMPPLSIDDLRRTVAARRRAPAGH